MIRRFSAALIGLALCLPVFAAAPVAAHTSGGLTVDVTDTWTDAGGTHVVGTVTNHNNGRHAGVTLTATWELGTVDESQSAAAFTSNLAPHATSPFHITETADVSGSTGLTVTSGGTFTSGKPGGTGGIQIEVVGLVGDVYTVNLTNQSGIALTGVRVSAFRSGTNSDAAQSAAADLGISAVDQPYTITFDDDSDGTVVSNAIATTTSGTFGTSWNNYFGDLGFTSLNFLDDIVFMAENGITAGCGNANFCPKSPVTRAQMAVFLDRANDFPGEPAADQNFTDLTGLSDAFKQSIWNIAFAGVTDGCKVTPKEYCPNSPVTRGQMSKFIVTAYGLTIVSTNAFTDDDGHFSEDYNDTMFANSITSGCGTGLYCPHVNVPREQMAVFIHKAETP